MGFQISHMTPLCPLREPSDRPNRPTLRPVGDHKKDAAVYLKKYLFVGKIK